MINIIEYQATLGLAYNYNKLIFSYHIAVNSTNSSKTVMPPMMIPILVFRGSPECSTAFSRNLISMLAKPAVS